MCLKETRIWASRSCSEGWPMRIANFFSSTGLLRALARIQLRWQRHWQPIRRSDLSFIGLFRGQLLVALISQFSLFNFIDFSSCLYYILCFACFAFLLSCFLGFSNGPSMNLQVSGFRCTRLAFHIFSWCCSSCIPWILIPCVFIHIQSDVWSLFSFSCADY